MAKVVTGFSHDFRLAIVSSSTCWAEHWFPWWEYVVCKEEAHVGDDGEWRGANGYDEVRSCHEPPQPFAECQFTTFCDAGDGSGANSKASLARPCCGVPLLNATAVRWRRKSGSVEKV